MNPRARQGNPPYSVTLCQGTLGRVVCAERRRYAECGEGRSGAMLFAHRDGAHKLKFLASNPTRANTELEKRRLLKQMP